MTAAYGSSWRDRRAKVDNSNAPNSHKMPPFLRLNSTGEPPSIDERPANSMVQQRTPITSDKRHKGFIGKIASHVMPQANAPGARQFLDIHTAVRGIAALDEHLLSGEAKTMASYVIRGTRPVERQAIQTSKPVVHRSNPSHVLPSRYGQWTVDGLSPYMQPGVFPCHMFSAMQVGSSFGQNFPNVWNGQSRLLASVSDSVLNCQVGQNFPFQIQVPFAASPGRGRGSVYNNHSCDSKPSASQPCSLSQKKAGSTDCGHCVHTARYQNGGHYCVCEKESSVDTHSKNLQCNSLHGSPCQYRDSSVKTDPNGDHSTSVQPCKITVSVGSNSDCVVSKAVDICSCDNKAVENAPKDKPDIPESCDSIRPSSSTMSSILQLVFERKHIAECELNMSLTPLIVSSQTTGVRPCAAESHSKTSISHSDKVGSVDDNCEISEMSYSRNDNSVEDLHPTFTLSTKKLNSVLSDTVDIADHAATDADLDDDNDDISFRSESDTAASASSASCSDTQQNTLCSGAQDNISTSELDRRQTSNLEPARDLDHCLFEADDLEADCGNDEEVDWNDCSDDETEDAFTPKDSDFFDLDIPALSSFLPGQASHPCPSFSGASCAFLSSAEQVEVLFCPNDEDALDGACGRIFNDDGTVRALGKNRGLSKAANERWDLHYSKEVPEEKTIAKVRFQCGEGVDRCHEFERMEVELGGDEDTSHMTCMELQKLMDERRRHGRSGHSNNHDEDEDI